MPDTQPIKVDRTDPHYKVGAATVAVESLLHGAYGPLSPEQTEKLLQLRDTLRTEKPARPCGVYGFPSGECRLPLGHWPATPHDLGVSDR